MPPPCQYFVLHPSYLITDPRNSTRAGDVVRFARWPYARGSPRVQHIVTEIVSAFGPRLDERPPLPTAAEREQMVLGMEERVAEKRRARIRRKMAEQQTAEEETETKTEKVEARRPRRREGRAGREAREAEGEGRDAAARARGRGETA